MPECHQNALATFNTVSVRRRKRVVLAGCQDPVYRLAHQFIAAVTKDGFGLMIGKQHFAFIVNAHNRIALRCRGLLRAVAANDEFFHDG